MTPDLPSNPAGPDQTAAFPAVVPDEPSPQRRRRRRRRWVVVSVLLVALVGAGYAAAFIRYSDRIAAGTSVAGIDIGTLSAAAAEQRLRDRLPERVLEPIPVTVADQPFEVDPVAAGLTVDYAATVDATGAGSANPLDLWRSAFGGGEEVPVVPVVDRVALDAAVTAIAGEADREPVDASVSFSKGNVVTEPAAPGIRIDREAAADAIATGFPADEAVALPFAADDPAVTDDEALEVVTTFAEPAMSAPVKVSTELGTTELTPSQLGEALQVTAEDGGLVPNLDGEALLASAASSLAKIGEQARDARVEIRSNKPVVIPSRKGRGVTAEDLSSKILPVLTETGAARAAELDLTVAKPEYTTADARKGGVARVISSFTTYFPYAEYRNVNIGRAAALVDNTFLKPGDTFSLNGVVGERTRANGFTAGFIISEGQFREELGGGVSQMATTAYNAGHFAGYEDVEHKPHSLYISRYPVGREATVAWPTLDMKFRNNTPYAAVVETLFSRSTPGSQGSLTVRIWSTPHWDVTSSTGSRYNFRSPSTVYDTSDRCTATAPVQGFNVDVTRTIRLDGKVVARETDTAVYAATNRVICGSRPG